MSIFWQVPLTTAVVSLTTVVTMATATDTPTPTLLAGESLREGVSDVSYTRIHLYGSNKSCAYELIVSRDTKRGISPLGSYRRSDLGYRVTWSARRVNVKRDGWATWRAWFKSYADAERFFASKLTVVREWAARQESEAA